MTQQLTKAPETALSYMRRDSIKARFVEVLGNNGVAFQASVLTVINGNDKLKKCTPESVYMSCLMAATLKLPINPQLGFAYIIGYEDRQKGIFTAQFQMGYKGFIQLALRSGEYQTISASPIFEGQLISENPLTGYEFDFTMKPKKDTPIIGYASYFKLLNGFEKTEYMTAEEVESHGKKYSKTYNSGPWKTDFDGMARKTVIKKLLSGWGVLSIELEKAIAADQAVIKDVETNDMEYPDKPNTEQIEKGNASVEKVLNKANKEVKEVLFTALNDCEVMDSSDHPVQVLGGDEVHSSKIPGVCTIGINYINLSQIEGNENFILTV